MQFFIVATKVTFPLTSHMTVNYFDPLFAITRNFLFWSVAISLSFKSLLSSQHASLILVTVRTAHQLLLWVLWTKHLALFVTYALFASPLTLGNTFWHFSHLPLTKNCKCLLWLFLSMLLEVDTPPPGTNIWWLFQLTSTHKHCWLSLLDLVSSSEFYCSLADSTVMCGYSKFQLLTFIKFNTIQCWDLSIPR